MRQELIARFADIDVYPVTSEPLSAGRDNLAVLDGLLAGGAKAVQLRDKHKTPRELYELALVFRERTRAAGALLIVNDALDIALAVEADGVHLGQDDLPMAAARKLAPHLLIGRSTHSYDQAMLAEAQGADYVNLGPLFATQTKSTPHAPLGLTIIEQVAPALAIPFTVMGGIKLAHVPELVVRGATRIAVVTALTQAPDIAAATRDFRAAILAAKSS